MADEVKDIPFADRWCLWYHYDTSTWTTGSFKLLMNITSVGELWAMVDALQANEAVLLEHLYVMREGVAPIWEDKRNRNGGCWSIKVDLKDSFNVFVKILAFVLGENSLIAPDGKNLSSNITGISFCSKNQFSTIAQIWTSDKHLNKTTLLHPEISEPYMAEIIYRSHVPEY